MHVSMATDSNLLILARLDLTAKGFVAIMIPRYYPLIFQEAYLSQ
jgi:hypothetical protein